MYAHNFLWAAKLEIIANADSFIITFSTRSVLYESAAILVVSVAPSQSLLFLRGPGLEVACEGDRACARVSGGARILYE